MPTLDLIAARDVQVPGVVQSSDDITPGSAVEAEGETEAGSLRLVPVGPVQPRETPHGETSAVAVEGAASEPKPASKHQMPTQPKPVQPSSPLPGQARRKNTSARNLARHAGQNGAAADEAALPQLFPPEKLAGIPFTFLDTEIIQLRKQLAEKLRLQNAQLRAMLERYDNK